MDSKKLAGALGAGIFALGIAASAAPAQAATFAVNAANGTAAADQIDFAIPGAGTHVISLAGPLPAVTQPVAIRGYTQPGSSQAAAGSAANPTIVIDATNVPNGLQLAGDDSKVRGLVVNRAQTDGIRITGDRNVVTGSYVGTNAAGNAAQANAQYGVHVDGDDNVLGGPAPEDRNVISGNNFGGVLVHGTGNLVEGSYLGTDETGTAGIGSGGGVLVEFASQNTVKDNLISFNVVGVTLKSNDNTVQGNSIGTDVNGTAALGNFTGVSVLGGDRNLIGGAADGEGNLVSGNLFSGVHLGTDDDDPAEDNEVQGNLIGTDAAGTAPLPNDTGVDISASGDNTVGGTAPGAGNVISANDTDGVRILSDGADDNDVQGNWIGTDEAETLDLGNGASGVDIDGGSQNRVGATLLQNPANVIAYNDLDGVTVTSGIGNSIVRNSLHDNDELGIDLDANGTTPNDGPLDPDSGPNTLQNGPVIDNATTATQFVWDLDTEANADYRLEFYSNEVCDPSGSGEGQTFLDAIVVTTDANGHADGATVTATPAGSGKWVSMTATRLNGANQVARSTSEFSPCRVTP
jgi:parallel beta-helix repeat protein